MSVPVITPVAPTVTTITKAAIISCNPLISTCASTPLDVDFHVSIWKNTGGSQWQLVTHDTTYVTSITYDTSANNVAIVWALSGTYRVVITG